MTRGFGVTERLTAGLDVIEPLLALLTQLGDAWFLVVLTLWLYWFGDRTGIDGWTPRHGLVLLGVALWAFGVTLTLKGLFALPRPAGATAATYSPDGPLGALYRAAATGTGFGFPSGHAVSAAAVYGTIGLFGGLAAPRRRRWAVAGLIAFVSFTRLGLGVHFLVDVLVGAAIGIALAWGATHLADRPAVLFGLASTTAVVAVAVAGLVPKPIALLAGSTVALAAWWAARPVATALEGPALVSPVVVVLVGLACLIGAVVLVGRAPTVTVVGAGALGTGLTAVALPGVSRAPEKERRPQKVSR